MSPRRRPRRVLLRAIVVRIVTALTLGLGALALNGAVMLLVASFEPGLHVESLWAGMACAAVHVEMRRRLAALGHTAYEREAAPA